MNDSGYLPHYQYFYRQLIYVFTFHILVHEDKDEKPRISTVSSPTFMDEIFMDDEEDDVVVTQEEPPIPLRVRATAEIETYRALPKMKSSGNIVEFWSQKLDSLPLLTKLTRKYLIVQASSVASERIFSTAGDVVSAERSCLKPECVNMLIFLNKNS